MIGLIEYTGKLGKNGGFEMIPVPRWVVWLCKPIEFVFSAITVILSLFNRVRERVKKIGRGEDADRS